MANKIVGPPHGMIRPDIEILLCQGDSVFEARFLCWDVILMRTRECLTALQVGKVTEELRGCHTSHIMELAIHKHLLATKVRQILHNPEFE
eukprot:6199260-Heterocapsa_arctica.AAC.1